MRNRLIRAFLAAGLVAAIIPATVAAHFPLVDRYAYVSQWYSTRHPAIDIAAPIGTKIVPIRSGTVVWTGWSYGGGGKGVIIYHGSGMYTAYYHLSRIHAWKGEYVSDQRTVIGEVGMTGDATGPHTHTEVWHGYPWHSGSYRVNPWSYIDTGWYLPYRYL